MAEPREGLVKRTLDALDERTGYRALVATAAEEPVKGGARFAYVWGSALLAAILVQIVTGWLLMTVYSPSATTAWASVHYLTFKVSWGWFVRGLHHFGSSATVILLAAHVAQTALYGAYKRPREMNWWFGLLLLAIVLGFALTGYLLPWDQKGYWSTRVATNIMGTVPVVGGMLQTLMQGGSAYGHLTLTRFYALHVGVLPALLVGLIAGHVYLFRRHGVTPPASADLTKSDRFFPKQLAYDVLASMVMIAVLVGFVIKEHGAPLDAPADPSSDYPARPEWYFLSLFQLLKYFHGPLEAVGTIVLPGVVAAFLVALPILDRKPGTALKGRAIWVASIFGGLVVLIALGLVSRQADARDASFQKARAKADERAKYANELAMAGVPPEGPLSMLQHDPKLRGEEIWEHSCKGCHTFDGNGGNSAPDLSGWGSKAWVESMIRDPDQKTRFGKSPFLGKMPSFVTPPPSKEEHAEEFKPLTDAQISSIAAFVSGEANEPGKKDFELQCNGCHALDGDGGSDDMLAPDLARWGSYGWLRAQIANPGSGTTYKEDASSAEYKGHMPAFEANPDVKADLDAIAQWVFTKAKGRAPTVEEMKSVEPAEPPSKKPTPSPSGSGSASK